MLSPAQTKIIDYLNDGEWKCMANANFYMKDDRKRISELRAKGYEIESKECDGRCGVQHNSRLFMRRLIEAPKILKYEYREIERDGQIIRQKVLV